MAARKPSPPSKKASPPKKKAPAAPSALGNDPFKKGAATRAVTGSTPGGPPPRPGHVPTPELQRPAARPVLQPISEKPKTGSGLTPAPPRFSPPPAPKVTPIRPVARAAPDAPPSEPPRATPHAGTVRVQGRAPNAPQRGHAVEPRAHAGTPSAQPLSGPTAHRGSPSAEPLTGPTPHRGSPSVTVEPRAHAGTPSAEPLTSATPHRGSPSVTVEPRAHAGTPVAEPLTGPMPHRGSPSVTVEPRAHAGTPSAEPLTGPTPHRGSPSVTVDPRAHADAPFLPSEVEGRETTEASGAPAPWPGTDESRSAPASRDFAALDSARGERGLSQAPSVTTALKGLFDAARTAVGFSSRSAEVDRWGKDTTLASSLRPLGELLYEKYWRVRLEGLEHLPASGPFIIVANHAGALPLDGPILHLALRRERPDLPESRWLLEDQIFHAPFVGVLANRLGAVRASPENALRLLDEQRPLIVFPEGFHGLSKPFSERYRLKRFGRGGYVKIALRANVPIVPAAIIGGEESMPLLGKLPGGLLGVEYLPVTLPPLPARWHVRFAAPVSVEGAPREPEHDLAWVERKNLGVRDQIEAMLTDMLQHRESIF